MKQSELRYAVSQEFGEGYGRVLMRDLVLPHLAGRSPQQALDEGVPPREVWAALCEAADVPEGRRHGVGRPSPSK